MSTNFLIFNPNQANQETDAQYSADTSRSGGVGNSAVFASILANKLFYQLSAFVSSLAQALANKGYTVQDGNPAQLTATFANILTHADMKPPLLEISYTNAPVFDASQTSGWEMTLSGDVTGATLVNLSVGQELTFIVQQDANGGHAFNFPGNVLSPGTVDPTASKTSVQTFVVGNSLSVRPSGPMTVS